MTGQETHTNIGSINVLVKGLEDEMAVLDVLVCKKKKERYYRLYYLFLSQRPFGKWTRLGSN